MQLEIETSSGFCKNCYNLRRNGSAYCGNCAGERFPIYWQLTKDFPYLEKVREKFDIKLADLERIIFTYGNTLYSYSPISYGLMAHEITHVLQQAKIGKDVWWEKYLEDPKFRLSKSWKHISVNTKSI